MLDLEEFGPRDRKPQAHGNVLGDVVASHRQDAAMTDSAVDVDQVVGGAAADIDHKGTVVFLVLVEDDLGAGQRTQHDVLDPQFQGLDAAHRVVDPCFDPVDDVKIGVDLDPLGLERVDHVLVPIDVIGLEDGVKERVLRGEGDFLGLGLHGIQILLLDRPFLRKQKGSTVVEAPQMSPGDGDPDIADLDVRLVFGVKDGLANTLGGSLHVDNLPLSDAS